MFGEFGAHPGGVRRHALPKVSQAGGAIIRLIGAVLSEQDDEGTK